MADLKPYIINVSFPTAAVTWPIFARYLQDSRDFVSVWSYLPLTYIVKSYLNATQITEKLRQILGPNGLFIVAEVHPGNMNGFLPKPAWDWIYQDHSQPPQPLLDFFGNKFG